MHINNRIAAFLLVLGVALLPLGISLKIGADLVLRESMVHEFHGFVEEAQDQNVLGRTLFYKREVQKEHANALVNKLNTIEIERRKLQRQIENLREEQALHSGAPEEDAGDVRTVANRLRSNRFSNDISLSKASRLIGRMLLRAGLRSAAPNLVNVYRAEDVLSLRKNDQQLAKIEQLTEADVARNEKRVRATTEQLAAARQMIRQTHEVIAALQSHLARIDAQIERKQERERVAEGLIDPLHNKYAPAEERPVVFGWPATAQVTAGFHDEDYRAYFGIPHYGIDIAVTQGTRVRSAADGVVFTVRDGGMGFSYVLIGHRDGYATLYGHLSEIAVTEGQEVSLGDVIGFSGGALGTPGAGVVTTGAHLHFEMLQNGSHIDPLSVLP